MYQISGPLLACCIENILRNEEEEHEHEINLLSFVTYGENLILIDGLNDLEG